MSSNDTKQPGQIRDALMSIVDALLLCGGVLLLLPPIPSERGQPLSLFPSVLSGLIVLAIHHAWNWRRGRETWYAAIIKMICWVGIAAYVRQLIRLS